MNRKYTRAEREGILAFVLEYNQKHGRGGESAASRKFSVNPLTIRSWMKAGKGKASKSSAPGERKSRREGRKALGGAPKTRLATLRRMERIQERIAELQSEFEQLKQVI